MRVWTWAGGRGGAGRRGEARRARSKDRAFPLLLGLLPHGLGRRAAFPSLDCGHAPRRVRSWVDSEGVRKKRERDALIRTAMKYASSKLTLVFALVSMNAHPRRLASSSPCRVSTSRSWTRSILLPTRTTGTLSLSLTRATWCRKRSTRSNEAREVVE